MTCFSSRLTVAWQVFLSIGRRSRFCHPPLPHSRVQKHQSIGVLPAFSHSSRSASKRNLKKNRKNYVRIPYSVVFSVIFPRNALAHIKPRCRVFRITIVIFGTVRFSSLPRQRPSTDKSGQFYFTRPPSLLRLFCRPVRRQAVVFVFRIHTRRPFNRVVSVTANLSFARSGAKSTDRRVIEIFDNAIYFSFPFSILLLSLSTRTIMTGEGKTRRNGRCARRTCSIVCRLKQRFSTDRQRKRWWYVT